MSLAGSLLLPYGLRAQNTVTPPAGVEAAICPTGHQGHRLQPCSPSTSAWTPPAFCGHLAPWTSQALLPVPLWADCMDEPQEPGLPADQAASAPDTAGFPAAHRSCSHGPDPSNSPTPWLLFPATPQGRPCLTGSPSRAPYGGAVGLLGTSSPFYIALFHKDLRPSGVMMASSWMGP